MNPSKSTEQKAQQMPGKQQLLDAWFDSRLKQCTDEMLETEKKLNEKLEVHGLKSDLENPLTSVKKLLSPDITPSTLNEFTPLDELDALLKQTLKSQLSKDPKKTNLTKGWAKVRTLFANTGKESKDETTLAGNTRENIKKYLIRVSGITELDPVMNAYQNARIKYLADLMAYKNARRILNRRSELQKKYPDCHVEDIHLIRHEVCTNLTKMGGAKKDTGLTGVYKPHSNKQSQYDLSAIRRIRSTCARALKEVGEIKNIELHISPIKRAYQTAVFAGFDPDIPDSTLVSRLYTETKHGKTRLVGARSSDAEHEDGALEQLVGTMDQFKNKIIEPNAFSKNEVDQQVERIDAAIDNIFTQASVSSSEYKGANEKDVFAHGGANRDFIERFRQRLERDGIPHNIPFGKAAKVGFGDDFVFHIMRNQENGQIVAVDFEGQFTNRGELRPHVTKSKPDKDLSSDEYDRMEQDDFLESENPDKNTAKETVKFHFPGGTFSG